MKRFYSTYMVIGFLFLGFSEMRAQYLYKVEYDLTVASLGGPNPRSVSANMDVNLFGETQILLYNVFNGSNASFSSDTVHDFPAEYSEVGIYYRDSFVFISFEAYNVGCYEAADIVPDMFPEANVDYFRIYRIGFAEQNDYDPIDTELKDCEAKTFRITKDISCQNVGINYGVEYQVGANTGNWDVLIPYGNHPNEFDI